MLRYLNFLLSVYFLAVTPFCSANSVAMRLMTGDFVVVDVEPTDRFCDVIESLQDLNYDDGAALNQEFLIDFMIAANDHEVVAKSQRSKRIYENGLSKQDIKDISFIVTTLGNDSLGAIALAKSSLKRAGDRIDPVHPLKFLSCVFTDEKLKAAVHNLKDRTLWIWSDFFNGLKGSLDEEAARNNINSYIDDFAAAVDLDPSVIAPAIQAKKWKEFLDILILEIPRSSNYQRYNM
jgi:hypothetical protein